MPIDIDQNNLRLAKKLGADYLIQAKKEKVREAILDITARGVQVSIEALGLPETTQNSIHCLAKRGKHIQIGLLERRS